MVAGDQLHASRFAPTGQKAVWDLAGPTWRTHPCHSQELNSGRPARGKSEYSVSYPARCWKRENTATQRPLKCQLSSLTAYYITTIPASDADVQ
jgi:hypothetical protein